MDPAVNILGYTFFLSLALIIALLTIVGVIFFIRLIKWLRNVKDNEIFGV